MSTQYDTALAAKAKLRGQKLAVASYGITKGNDGYAVKVNIAKESLRKKFPKEVDGVEIVVEFTGKNSKRKKKLQQ